MTRLEGEKEILELDLERCRSNTDPYTDPYMDPVSDPRFGGSLQFEYYEKSIATLEAYNTESLIRPVYGPYTDPY